MSSISDLPDWVRDNQAYCINLTKVDDSSEGVQVDKPRPANVGGTANVLSSRTASSPSVHYPMIDLDVSHALIPSSTPGHAHLYINVPLASSEYRNVLVALRAAGIIQQGILDQFDTHGATFLRLPDVKKLPTDNGSGEAFDFN